LEVKLLNIVKNEITRDRKPAARRNPTFYPSSASAEMPDGTILGGCQRADWYRIHNVKPSNGAEFYMHFIWHLGRAVESKVIDAMKCAGVYENDGVKFFDRELNVSGELDIVGRYRKDGKVRYYGVEVKSVYGIGCTYTITGRKRAWKGQAAFDPFPKESNLMQPMVYLDQFGSDMEERYQLDYFKLLYLPRDKPNDGREYNVCLVTKDDLGSAMLLKYGPEMTDGEHYAYVSTADFSDKIETRFSIEDLYRRWGLLKRYIEEDIAPPRAHKKFFSEKEINQKREDGKIGKTAFEKWEKAGKPKSSLEKTPGHYMCQSYCDYRSFCYTKTGQPRKEADQVGLVQVSEPKEISYGEAKNTEEGHTA